MVGVSAGCVDAQSIPDPPSAEGLEEAYSQATGVLSPEEIQQTLSEFDEGQPIVRTFDEQTYVDEVVGTTASLSSGGGDLQLGKIRFEGEAALHIERECESVDQEAPGVFRGHVTFTLSGLHPVLWGELEDCVRETTQGPARFNGDFIISLDRVDGFEVDPDYWTSRFTGQIESLDPDVMRVVEEGVFDAQRRGEELRARVATGDGDWAFLSYSSSEPEQLMLVDREMSYVCDIVEQTCMQRAITGDSDG